MSNGSGGSIESARIGSAEVGSAINESAGIEIEWSHTTAEVIARGLDVARTASPQQCQAIAEALGLLAVERLMVRYHIEQRPGGRFRLTGRLAASVVQACVVTLDPVAADLQDAIEVEFWPADSLPQSDETEQGILEAEEHEPIENHRLAVGRIVLETLAAVLPAYPRTADAALDHTQAGPEAQGRASPFAALANWKPRGS